MTNEQFRDAVSSVITSCSVLERELLLSAVEVYERHAKTEQEADEPTT
jgi:hypothetical protein